MRNKELRLFYSVVANLSRNKKNISEEYSGEEYSERRNGGQKFKLKFLQKK